MATINQILTDLEQYHAQGGDITAVSNACSTMLATGKTPLGLNQWQRSDKPMMEDFNEDNRIVDEKLRELAEEKASRDGTLQQNLNSQFLNGYSVNNESTGGEWPNIPSVNGAGVTEIGVYLDFHDKSNDTKDYTARIYLINGKLVVRYSDGTSYKLY